jgi:hypothetical protein
MLINYLANQSTVNISAEGSINFTAPLSISGGGAFKIRGKRGIRFEA